MHEFAHATSVSGKLGKTPWSAGAKLKSDEPQAVD
jgi:hypothetical protein